VTNAAIAIHEITSIRTELVAQASEISQQCSACIKFYVRSLTGLGANRGELKKTFVVYVYLGGRAVLMDSAEALATFDELANPLSLTQDKDLLRRGRHTEPLMAKMIIASFIFLREIPSLLIFPTDGSI